MSIAQGQQGASVRGMYSPSVAGVPAPWALPAKTKIVPSALVLKSGQLLVVTSPPLPALSLPVGPWTAPPPGAPSLPPAALRREVAWRIRSAPDSTVTAPALAPLPLPPPVPPVPPVPPEPPAPPSAPTNPSMVVS